jgi:hypothetical protein
MLRRTSIIACLAACTAASASVAGPSTPGYISAGPLQSDPGNAQFFAAVTYTNGLYNNLSGQADAGATFDPANTLNSATGMKDGKNAVRVWFVSESADYTNALGVSIASDPKDSIIFPISQGTGAPTYGSYVDLNGGGVVQTSMDFFALTNLNSTGTTAESKFFGNDHPDGHYHLDMVKKGWMDSAGSLWYALALDDQLGNDHKKGSDGVDGDWNDLRVLIQIHPVATPEPATIALLAGFMVIGAWLWRRQQNVLA